MLLSESLGVSSAQLWKYGVFDSYIGIDSLLHVDPARLRATRIPELKGSYKFLHRHFEELLDLIEAAHSGDALERQAIQKIIAPEIKEAALGYAKSSNSGHGVTKLIAKKLYETAKVIINAGIKNPAIFEMAVLFEDGFGADLISDMTVFILLPQLSAFNKRVAEKLGLKTTDKYIFGKTGTFVYSTSQEKNVLLIPHSLLADLPLARDWSEIDLVTEYNNKLRARINKEVQKIWGSRVKNPSKFQIKRVLIEHPNLLRDLLIAYSKANAESYDFKNDPRGVIIWHQASREFTAKNPLALIQPKTINDVYSIVSIISDRFKHLIEQKGLADLLFDDRDKPKPESATQLLFFGIADSYCSANNLDLSREPQTGRGPADFKISRGHNERVIVELKLSSNSAYLDGLTAQLPAYQYAEEVKHAIFILIKVGEHNRKLKRLREVHSRLLKEGKSVPDLIIIDAIKKLSASRLKGFFDF